MAKTLKDRVGTSDKGQVEPRAEVETSGGKLHDELRSTDGLEAQEAKLRPQGGKKTPPPRPGTAHPAQPAASIKRTNVAQADRLQEGANATKMLSQAVDAAQSDYQAKIDAHEAALAHNKKRTIWQKLTRKNKQEIPPLPPARQHLHAKAELAGTYMALGSEAKRLRASDDKPKVPLLPRAAASVDGTADRMAGKTEGPIVDSTRDLAVGLREGKKAMLDRVLARGGTLYLETLKMGKKIAQNKTTLVASASYLGMAPVVYKGATNRTMDDNREDFADASILNEHATSRAANGGENTLRTGGRVTNKPGRIGYIMELAKNGDLEDVAQATEGMPLSDRLEVWKHLMRGGFKGLAQLHGRGMVHGDVKNQNFLLGDDHEAKLMDFGETKKEADAAWSGTAEYMAPEVGKGGDSSKAGDVWSMGETLLRGFLRENSTMIAHDGQTVGANFKQETRREADLQDGAWLTKLRAKVNGLDGADVFMDFIQKVMAMDPKDRISADAALKHDFLVLKEGEKNKGKEKLAERLAREG